MPARRAICGDDPSARSGHCGCLDSSRQLDPGRTTSISMDWIDLHRESQFKRVKIFSQLLTCANEPKLKSQAGYAYRVVKQGKAGAPDTIRTCDLCLRRAAVIHIVQGDQPVAASERIVKGCDANREPKPYRFLSFGLNEMPSRIAIFLTDSGFRPVAFAASSNDFEARASSIKRRCSANDQIDF
jgi:hypothetical protein